MIFPFLFFSVFLFFAFLFHFLAVICCSKTTVCRNGRGHSIWFSKNGKFKKKKNFPTADNFKKKKKTVIDERSSKALSSEIRYLRIELDERSSIVQDVSKLPHFQNIYLKEKTTSKSNILQTQCVSQ